ncbi:uncharacterized protein PFLUO_LOCUS768 [Penicillium psychrofluorescens]|uniref:uncharacterized protein n=1 Tax=Penicillium psychrofluorescens TaxID=3158075 RepID=UPI003CCD82B5
MFGGTILKKVFLSILGGDGINPFSIMGALLPPDASGKYIIESEGIRLAFVRKGGALANLWINDTNCRELDVVLGFDNSSLYETYPGPHTLNGAIGRYAGVISNGEFELNGQNHYPSKNHRDGKSTLHGGNKGWGQMTLYPAAKTKNSITFVVFDRGNNGFPGRAAASLTHTLTPYEWRIAYGVTPLVAAFPISLSQQVFWNLGGFLSPSSSSDPAEESSTRLRDHSLHLPFSGMRLDADEHGIPTGDIKGNPPNSTFDYWSRPRAPSEPLDDTFLVNRRQPWDMHAAPVATLANNHSGIKLDLYTNQEALHTVTWEQPEGALKRKRSQGEGDIPSHAAISLQMQDWTDAISHPEWQREAETIWGADRLYTMYTSYKFSVRRDVGSCG